MNRDKSQESARDNKFLQFLSDYRSYWGWLLLYLCIAAIAGLIQIGLANIGGRLVDLGMAGSFGAIPPLAWLLLGLLALELVRGIVTCVANANATERIFLDVRMRLADRLMHADVGAFETRFRTGDMLSRLNGDVFDLCEALAGAFPWLLRVALTAVIALVYCVFVSWPLALVYIIVTPLSVWIVQRVSKPIQAQTKQKSDRTGAAMNIALDAFHGIRVVKSFQLEGVMRARFAAASDEAVDAAIRSERTAIRLNVVKYVMNILPIFALFLLSAWLVGAGRLTVGGIIAFMVASVHIRTAFGLLDYMVSSYRRACAMAERIYEALELPQEEGGADLSPIKGRPAVSFDGVRFAYEGGQTLYEALSFDVPAGRKIGIAGLSGSGKSSILKLICRFYKPRGGALVLLGHDSRDWSPAALRSHIAMVTQEPYLLMGSLYDNVACGRPDATREDVRRALEDAALWDFVQTLPGGMDTPVGELGARLSGGQKQRLTIARAFVKDAPIVLLDEVTSALDARTEREVLVAIRRLCEGRTVVMVSHRLSLFALADEILFLKDGAITEHGPRDALLRRDGDFARMMRAQEDMADA